MSRPPAIRDERLRVDIAEENTIAWLRCDVDTRIHEVCMAPILGGVAEKAKKETKVS